jgi:translation initiation factor RLI1
MKVKALSGFIFFFICFVGFEYAKMYYKEKRERERITECFQASQQTLTYYRTQNGQLAAKNQALQLRYNEVQQIFPKVLDEIRNLDIKPKLVTQYSETVVKQEKEILTKLRDSLICDTIHAKVFNYQDSFYTVKGIAVGDSQKVHISSLDSLAQVVYKGKRMRPWLWIFSRRKMEQVITSKNPNSKILYNRTIQIVKK